MFYLFNVFLKFFTLKSSPSELPSSKSLLILLSMASLLIGVIVGGLTVSVVAVRAEIHKNIPKLSSFDFFIIGLVKLLLLFIFIYLLLSFYKKSSRFFQVCIAIVGVDIIFSILLFVGIFLLQFSGLFFVLFFVFLYFHHLINFYFQ